MGAIRRLLGGSEIRRLSKDCEKMLADFPLPDPFSLQVLLTNIEKERGCTIHLVPAPDVGTDLRTACGLRVCLGTTNVILYRPRPTPNQTQNVIFHELAHLWFDHGSVDDALLLPEVLQHVLLERFGHGAVVQARAHYDTVEERQAEMAASLISYAIGRGAPPGADVLSAMEASLTHPIAPLRIRHQP